MHIHKFNKRKKKDLIQKQKREVRAEKKKKSSKSWLKRSSKWQKTKLTDSKSLKNRFKKPALQGKPREIHINSTSRTLFPKGKLDTIPTAHAFRHQTFWRAWPPLAPSHPCGQVALGKSFPEHLWQGSCLLRNGLICSLEGFSPLEASRPRQSFVSLRRSSFLLKVQGEHQLPLSRHL